MRLERDSHHARSARARFGLARTQHENLGTHITRIHYNGRKQKKAGGANRLNGHCFAARAKCNMKIYNATLQCNITTDVKKKRRGARRYVAILYFNIMLDVSARKTARSCRKPLKRSSRLTDALQHTIKGQGRRARRKSPKVYSAFSKYDSGLSR